MTDPVVFKLQTDLNTLGFTLVGKPDGVAGPRTHQAVREFQVYARMPRVARAKTGADRWIETLEQVVNVKQYAGPIHGLADQATLDVIAAWLHDDNRYRCPVVVEARRRGKEEFVPSLQNVWAYDDPAVKTFIREQKLHPSGRHLEFRVCDFTGAAPPATSWDQMETIGKRNTLVYVGGHTADLPHMTLEMLPERFTDRAWNLLSADEQAVFKVIRVTAEQECLAYFDSLNGIDNAVMSLGPCHWTLCIGAATPPRNTTRAVGGGELPPFLAFTHGRDSTFGDTYLTRFGIGIDGEWKKGRSGKFFDESWSTTRNYIGWMSWTNAQGASQRIAAFQDVQWFRTTHWFYRFIAMCRESDGLRKAQWDMVRLRIRDILDKPLGGMGPFKQYRIGELYTSPLAVALLLRCHVRYSSFMGPNENATTVGRALKLANVQGTPATWKDPQEARLIEGLLALSVRASYPLSEIMGKSKEQPTREQLIAFGKARKKQQKLHQGLEAIRKWPDAALFARRGYQLDAAARVPLSAKRNEFKPVFERLVADTTLPPPPR